ncbi:hypothetical protein FHX34_103909 [Actinoplanes teichomyceticus]|uniref:Uncharacterized protein n=1 Tax=Actinoplanes teichomyceticus TaxID=1867 RepID=A0A561WBY4_ACTTI|nr:hypothetical protein FHX34_103909 [Actinoplanes teichomyceticus]
MNRHELAFAQPTRHQLAGQDTQTPTGTAVPRPRHRPGPGRPHGITGTAVTATQPSTPGCGCAPREGRVCARHCLGCTWPDTTTAAEHTTDCLAGARSLLASRSAAARVTFALTYARSPLPRRFAAGLLTGPDLPCAYDSDVRAPGDGKTARTPAAAAPPAARTTGSTGTPATRSRRPLTRPSHGCGSTASPGSTRTATPKKRSTRSPTTCAPVSLSCAAPAHPATASTTDTAEDSRVIDQRHRAYRHGRR